MMNDRRGVALWFAFLTLMVLFLGGLILSQLSQGVNKQIEYSDANIRAQYIAETGLNVLLGRLMAKPWKDRWFAAGPDSAADIAFGAGTYDFFIQDAPGKTMVVDIWIRSSFHNARRAFFWRVRFSESLFEGIARGTILGMQENDVGKQPTTVAAANSLSQEMDNRTNTRIQNHPMVDAIGKDLIQTNDARNAATKIGITEGSQIAVAIPQPAPEAPPITPTPSPVLVFPGFTPPASSFDPPNPNPPTLVVSETPPQSTQPPPPRTSQIPPSSGGGGWWPPSWMGKGGSWTGKGGKGW